MDLCWQGNVSAFKYAGNPLQYSCLENPMDRGAWWATVHGVAKNWTWLSDLTHFSLSYIGEGNSNSLQYSCLENPRDRGAWWAAVYGVTQSWTRMTRFSIISSLVIAFLPRSKRLNFMAAVTICSNFGAPKNKGSHCFLCFPTYLPWSDGTGCHLSFLNVEF